MPETRLCESSSPCEAVPPLWTTLPEEIASCLESAKVLYRVCQLQAAREADARRSRTGGGRAPRKDAHERD